jgi:hypothetical protein
MSFKGSCMSLNDIIGTTGQTALHDVTHLLLLIDIKQVYRSFHLFASNCENFLKWRRQLP